MARRSNAAHSGERKGVQATLGLGSESDAQGAGERTSGVVDDPSARAMAKPSETVPSSSSSRSESTPSAGGAAMGPESSTTSSSPSFWLAGFLSTSKCPLPLALSRSVSPGRRRTVKPVRCDGSRVSTRAWTWKLGPLGVMLRKITYWRLP